MRPLPQAPAGGRGCSEPMARYPAFGLIRAAGCQGGTYPAAVSAANDVAVEQFVAGRVGFANPSAFVVG